MMNKICNLQCFTMVNAGGSLPVIHFFRPHNGYGWLSNFSSHGFFLEGRFWSTVENYYQARKFIASPMLFETIYKIKSPKKVKRFSRANAAHILTDWDNIKDEVMYRALVQKFKTHPKLTSLLKSTEGKELVENSHYDYYWGCGEDGSGQNKLGKMLMRIRNE